MTTAETIAARSRDRITTVGVDIVAVPRVAAVVRSPGGLERLLTDRERRYCLAQARPDEHMAGRFAAKEAVLKALGTGLAHGARWVDVEVVNDRGGRPRASLHGAPARRAAGRGLAELDISLSHTADLAIAQAVASWDPPAATGETMSNTTPAPQIRSLDDVPPDRRRGGKVRTLLSPRTVGSTSGFMGVATLEPGERIAEHYHPYSEEFVYLVAGRLVAELDDVPFSLAPRDGLLIPVGVRHRLSNPGDTTATAVFHLGPLAPRPDLGHVDTERA